MPPDRRPRPDSRRNRERIVEAAGRLWGQAPRATLDDVAAAAGVSRSTIYRHFTSRKDLLAAIREPTREEVGAEPREELMPPGRLGRERPVAMDAIHVFDAVAPPVLPEQLVAEAQRIAEVPLALYVVDIDGSHLLRVAGPERLPQRLEAPLAVGPGARLRRSLRASLTPLRPSGPACRAPVAPRTSNGRDGHPWAPGAQPHRDRPPSRCGDDPRRPLYGRVRRCHPAQAAQGRSGDTAEPPPAPHQQNHRRRGRRQRAAELRGGRRLVRRHRERRRGLGHLGQRRGQRHPCHRQQRVALGALRASRRSGGSPREALTVMHRTLREMPGPHPEMSAVVAHWDPTAEHLAVANCGHVAPVIVRADRRAERLRVPEPRGLGGRSSPRPAEQSLSLASGDRLVMMSDGVVTDEEGKAGLGIDGVIEAALRSARGTAADTVRKVHTAVLEASGGELEDDATVVCLSVS